MRTSYCFFVLTLLAVSTTAAQTKPADPRWTFTAQGGFHFDRVGRPERFAPDADGYGRYSSPGEAPAIGLRGTYWMNRFLGFDLGATISQNRSWAGSANENSPDFAKQTVFTSATIALRSGSPTRRLQAQFRFGPAGVFHAGSGESVLARQVDVGVTAALSTYMRVSNRLQLGVELQNYTFQSHYESWQLFGGGHVFGEDHRTRYEFVLLPSVRYWFK
jgi:hypothetical protein